MAISDLSFDEYGCLSSGTVPDLWELYSEFLGDDPLPLAIYSDRDSLPLEAAVYLMIDEGEVHYVGETVELAMRIHRHRHQWWERLGVIEPPGWWPPSHIKFWLRACESAAMRYYKPSENIAKARYGEIPPEALLRAMNKLPRTWPHV